MFSFPVFYSLCLHKFVSGWMLGLQLNLNVVLKRTNGPFLLMRSVDIFLLGERSWSFESIATFGLPTRKDHCELDGEICSDTKVSEGFWTLKDESTSS